MTSVPFFPFGLISSFCVGKMHQNAWLYCDLQNFPFYKMFLKCLFLLPTEKKKKYPGLKFSVRQKVWLLGSSKKNTSDLEKAFFLVSEYCKIFLAHSLLTSKCAFLFYCGISVLNMSIHHLFPSQLAGAPTLYRKPGEASEVWQEVTVSKPKESIRCHEHLPEASACSPCSESTPCSPGHVVQDSSAIVRLRIYLHFRIFTEMLLPSTLRLNKEKKPWIPREGFLVFSGDLSQQVHLDVVLNSILIVLWFCKFINHSLLHSYWWPSQEPG